MMRVVLKPAGIAVIAVTVAILGYVAFTLPTSKSDTSKETEGNSFAFPPSAKSSQPLPAVVSNFETGYKPYEKEPSDKSKTSGDIVSDWKDDSRWAQVTVKYSRDGKNPHSGSYSQRVEVSKFITGNAQLAQVLYENKKDQANGRRLKGTVWLRASRSTPVQLALRQQGEPYTAFAATNATVGKEWQKVEVTSVVRTDRGLYLLLGFTQPDTTIWVDDSEVTEVL